MTFFAQLLGKITVVRFKRINSAKCCLKTAGYLFPARNLMAFASQYEEIFIFEDLLLAPSSANFPQFISNRLTELEQNWPFCHDASL